jgi:Phosphotransferase enzyme family
VTAKGVASIATGAAFFLKLYAPDMIRFIDLDAAFAAARQAGELSIGPKMLADDSGHGAALFELLGFDVWRMAGRNDLHSRDVQAAVISAKRSWHRTPPLARTRSPFDIVRGYRAMIAGLPASHPTAAPPPLAYHTLAAWTDRFEQAIVATGVDPAPIHGDNALSNVMLGPSGAVRLVDFDQAVNADPVYDLGAFCLEICSFEREIKAAVELYVGRSDRQVLARAKLYMIVDDFLWGCWALIAHWTSPRSGGIEFYKYSQNCFVRAMYWLGNWELEELTRQA